MKKKIHLIFISIIEKELFYKNKTIYKSYFNLKMHF